MPLGPVTDARTRQPSDPSRPVFQMSTISRHPSRLKPSSSRVFEQAEIMGNPAEHLLERSVTQENDGNRRNDENRKIMKTSSTLLIALIAASASASPIWEMQKPVSHGLSVFAEAKKSRIAVDSQGVAIQGYDPVTYFTQNKPVKGSPSNQSVYQGAKFYFASAADKKEFDKNPSKYTPTYGGYCVNNLRKGKLVNGDPNVFFVYKGKLHFCSEKKGVGEFKKNIDQNLGETDNRWRQIRWAPVGKPPNWVQP
jgi:YHS domain-containing protein